MADVRPPKENIVRAMPSGYELRDPEEGGRPTLTGHFAVFNQPTEINSAYEGRFIEQIAPGAFTKTLSEQTPKVLFNHGNDPSIGDKILGVPSFVGEDETGARYEVPLFDTSFNRDLEPGLRADAYGSSFRFSVVRDEIVQAKRDSDGKFPSTNPDGLPTRTIREARVMEFGPVTFPAYAGATAGVRSMTDEYLRSIVDSDPAPSVDAGETHLEPERRDELEAPPPETATVTPQDPPDGGSSDSERTSEVEYISRDDKAARVTELEASIARRATEYTGVLPEDVQATDDAEVEERGKLLADIAAWDRRQDLVRSFGTDPERTGKNTERTYEAPTVHRKPEDIYDFAAIRSNTRSREEYDRTVKENALRSIDSARFDDRKANANALVDIIENRDAGQDGEGEIARRILLTGSPAYKRAFNKLLRGEQALWSPEESRAAALAVTGTTTTGGYAVPYVFDPTLIHIGVYTATNPFRQACRVETITNGNNWRAVTVGAVTSVYITEAGAATEQGPTFGQPSYTVQSAHAFATVSHETLQDRPDISGELTSVFAESKATYEENQFAVGVGTTVFPLGMFTDTAYTNQDTAGNDTTAIADILVLEGILPLRWRANAAFFMNRSTIRQLQALDTTYRYFSGAGIQYAGNSNPQNPPSGNTGLTLLGYPVWEVPSAVSTLTTDGAIIVVFADPKSYVIVDRLGMSVEVIPNMLNGATPSFPTGQRGIYARWRNTAKPIAADAGRSLSVQ